MPKSTQGQSVAAAHIIELLTAEVLKSPWNVRVEIMGTCAWCISLKMHAWLAHVHSYMRMHSHTTELPTFTRSYEQKRNANKQTKKN